MPVAVFVRPVDGVAFQHRVGRTGQIERDEAAVPVGHERELPVLGRLGAVPEDRIRVAALARVERAAGVVDDAPVGHGKRDCGIRHVDEPEIAASLEIAEPAW